MTDTHYVVVAYLGPRRIEDPRQVANRLFFINEHFRALERVTHELARITLVVNIDKGSREQLELVTDLATSMIVPTRIGQTPVSLVVRENDPGWSYSALVDVVSSKYTYTIFNEDDYIFTEDYFDTFLVESLVARPVAVMVAGMVRGEPMDPGRKHAAVASGIVRTEALMDFGQVVDPDLIPQLVWSRRLAQRGRLIDWLHVYATAFWHDHGVVRWFERCCGSAHADPMQTEPSFQRSALLVPIQALDRPVEIMYWQDAAQDFVRRTGRIDRRGKIVWP